MLDSVFLSASGLRPVFAMPGDPAVLNGAPAVLTAADLLMAVAVRLPPF